MRGQIANQELMIEKMRRENEKLKEKTRSHLAARPDSDLEMALRLSEMEHPAFPGFSGSSGLSEAEIDVFFIQSLPMFPIDLISECCVCKNSIPVDHLVKSLPFCGHLGHQPCIDQWLMHKKTCPECSAPVIL